MKKAFALLTVLLMTSVFATGCSGSNSETDTVLGVAPYEAPADWGTVSNTETDQSFRYPTDLYTTDLDFETFETIATRTSDGVEVFRVDLYVVGPIFIPSVPENEIEMWEEIQGTASWL